MFVKKDTRRRKIVVVTEVEIMTEIITEGTLDYLLRRYCVTRESIFRWRRYLGLLTRSSRHFYTPEEILELDYYFAAAYIPKKKVEHWGMRMGRHAYARDILDAGIDFNEYLQIHRKKDYQQFLEETEKLWQRPLFGN